MAPVDLGKFITFNESDHLEIDGCDVTTLVTQFGSPLWIISESTIRENFRFLRHEFERLYPSLRIAYASKANPHPAILKVLRSEGALVDVASQGQVELALAAGYRPANMILNGNSKTVEELSWALDHAVGVINVDSLEEMEAIASLQSGASGPARVSIRLGLDYDRFVDDPVFAGARSDAKFGMDEGDALRAARVATNHPGLDLVGVHSHVGWTPVDYSPRRDLERHRCCIDQVLDFVAVLRDEGTRLATLNVGGGFRTGRPEGFGPRRLRDFPTLQDYADNVAGYLARQLDTRGLAPPLLILETGGYLVANAAVLVAAIGFSKQRALAGTTENWVFLENTSAYHFVRRLIQDFYHHPLLANRRDARGSEVVVNIAGSTCADDSVAAGIRMPSLKRGDLIALLDQGAYCEAVSTEYCAIPLPASVMASHGRVEAVRRRELPADLPKRFAIPSWLDNEPLFETSWPTT